jgi:hypothetical protein
MSKSRKDVFRWRAHTGVVVTYDEMAEKNAKKRRAKLRRQKPEPGLRFYLGHAVPTAKQSALVLLRVVSKPDMRKEPAVRIALDDRWDDERDPWALNDKARRHRDATLLSKDWVIAHDEVTRHEVAFPLPQEVFVSYKDKKRKGSFAST